MAPDRGQAASRSGTSRAWEALTPSLSQWILEAITAMGFTRMNPVQASTIPLFLGNKDVVVEAVTGSGKTLAFLIPVIEKLLRQEEPTKRHHVAAIIVSPTRELASQIYDVLLSFLRFHAPSTEAAQAAGLSILPAETRDLSTDANAQVQIPAGSPKIVPQLLLGGSATPAQDISRFLKTSPNLLIGTPGRLLEILSSAYVHCSQSSFEVLVLDEADRLLDLGFKNDLTKIINFLPRQRRTGLFSASVSEAVDQIIRVGLRNPIRIAVKVKSADGTEDKRTPASLRLTYLIIPASKKLPALGKVLHCLNPMPTKTIVYLSTCAAVDYFQALLPAILPSGIILVPLHGKQPSTVRQKNFVRFTNSAAPALLLTTDVAARGLDIPSVDLVVQIDPPSDPKAFLHRCGRAGRAGRKGLSLIFLQPGKEEDYISFLDIRKTPIERLEDPKISVDQSDVEEVSLKFRAIVLNDRALFDKAQKGFVSWTRSYSKHQASSIFRLQDLDWSDLAEAWALLKMPKMPELKNWDRSGLHLPEVDWDEYRYKDKQQERKRKEELADFIANGPKPKARDNDKKRSSSTAWSGKLELKASKEVKRSKKEARREHDRKAAMTDAEREQEAETKRMIEKIRKQQFEAEVPFEGFG